MIIITIIMKMIMMMDIISMEAIMVMMMTLSILHLKAIPN